MIELVKEKPETETVSRESIMNAIESVEGISDVFGSIGSLLDMGDDQFEILAPGIHDAFQRSLNNTNSRIMMVQALNANHATVDDMRESFVSLTEEIDKVEDLSTPKKTFLKNIMNDLLTCLSETEGIAKRYIQIPYEKCHPNAKMPEYAHIGDSGMDVFALEDITINPGETVLVPTGLKFAVPNGYELQVRPKSGRCVKTKMRVANSPGTCDACYRGEVKVIIDNIEPPIKDIVYEFDDNGRPIITSILHGQSYTIGKGEKFAQLVLMEVPKANFYLVDKVDETDRADGGFGSTTLYSKEDERHNSAQK